MFCPDCRQGLDGVPVGAPCPQCGGTRRSARVEVPTANVTISAGDVSVQVGYSIDPGWTFQWRSIQRHLTRLRDQYQGSGARGNLDVEDTVHALFLDLYHLFDWLYQDSSLSLSQSIVKTWIDQHPNSLGLCRDYANTRKHAKRNHSGARIAQISQIENGPRGYRVTIAYGPATQPSPPMATVDALTLAQNSEQDWRAFLNQRNIPIPS
jgi:hypothetical protein